VTLLRSCGASEGEPSCAPDLSDAQRQELRERLAHHRANPDEPGVSLDDIRRKLIG
jgi:hypothetical protein